MTGWWLCDSLLPQAFIFPPFDTSTKLLPVVCRECLKCVWEHGPINLGRLTITPPGLEEFQLSGTTTKSQKTPPAPPPTQLVGMGRGRGWCEEQCPYGQ